MRKLLVQLFCYTGIPFGLVMTVFFIANQDVETPRGIVLGVLSGAVFGALMAAVIGYMHHKSVKKSTPGESKKSFGVKHQETITLSVSYEQAFELCLKSLDVLKRPVVQEKDFTRGVITVKTGKTWNTWGDLVTFQVQAIDEDAVSIDINSRPAIFQLVDYGQNHRNIQRVVSALKEEAQ